MVITIDVKVNEQEVADTKRLLKKLKRTTQRGRIPRGIYSTIHWWMEEIFRKTFELQGRSSVWPKSKRAAFGLGNRNTMVASGKLFRSLTHNAPKSLGVRDTFTGRFESLLPYGGDFEKGYGWMPGTDLRFNIARRRYVPVTGRSRRFKSLFRGGSFYNVPPRRLFDVLPSDFQQLERLLDAWMKHYSKKGVQGTFKVIEGGAIINL